MFGIGPWELVVVLVVGLLTLAIPIGVVVLLMVAFRKPKVLDADGATIAQLSDENQRLRNELAAVRNRPQT